MKALPISLFYFLLLPILLRYALPFFMGKNTTMSREALWLAIHEANTVEAWMQLTHEFNLYRIYTLFRIFNNPKQCETLRCRILKWFTLSLEAYDKSDASPQCFMAFTDGNVRECYTPASFSRLISDVMNDAMHDGALDVSPEESISADAEEEEMTDKVNVPLSLQYAAFIELLKLLKVDYQNSDKSKIIELFCAITGRSVDYVKRVVYQGCSLSKKSKSLITRINNAFAALKLAVSIDFGHSY